ncbi:unnamed protein product [Allacma fusca]|uniref:Adipose-secreted signaling protein n=1 Tax=Allacma fusca TaxID=39272 RepID=A0A8J2LBX9_9HEXA|nr:unnamed protein product [Allacma fusca]
MATANKLDEVQVITRGDHDPDRRSQTSQEKRAARNSRVHFGDFEDVDTSLFSSPENQPILVAPLKEELNKTLCAYFGFLQEAHRYEVKFGIPIDEIKSYVVAKDEKLEVKTQPSNSRLVRMTWEEHETIGLVLQMVMELEVQNAMSFEDNFIIYSESIPNRFINVRIAAQVLGKGQGTPTLKYGIKCLGHCPSTSPSGSPERSPAKSAPSPKNLC